MQQFTVPFDELCLN